MSVAVGRVHCVASRPRRKRSDAAPPPSKPPTLAVCMEGDCRLAWSWRSSPRCFAAVGSSPPPVSGPTASAERQLPPEEEEQQREIPTPTRRTPCLLGLSGLTCSGPVVGEVAAVLCSQSGLTRSFFVLLAVSRVTRVGAVHVDTSREQRAPGAVHSVRFECDAQCLCGALRSLRAVSSFLRVGPL